MREGRKIEESWDKRDPESRRDWVAKKGGEVRWAERDGTILNLIPSAEIDTQIHKISLRVKS